jgi:hypothetical protein
MSGEFIYKGRKVEIERVINSFDDAKESHQVIIDGRRRRDISCTSQIGAIRCAKQQIDAEQALLPPQPIIAQMPPDKGPLLWKTILTWIVLIVGFFKNLFGKSNLAGRNSPFGALGFAIIRAANQCRERMKPLLPPAKTKQDAIAREMYLLYEYLYFFMHMMNRTAAGQGFSARQIEELQQSVYPDIIASAIDSFMLHWPEEYKSKIEAEFCDNLNSAFIEYTTSKELISRDHKPSSSDSLLGKLSRNVAAVMAQKDNPEVLFQATLAGFEELRNAELPKLVTNTRPDLRN